MSASQVSKRQRLDGDSPSQWQYDDGQFEQGQGKNWIETFDNGGNCYFQEVSRNRDYIEIYDKSRDIAVRLYKTKMYLKQPNSNTFDYFPRRQMDRLTGTTDD